tara:strand:+ start:268 stop:390 length:123 start_codon:yes stop_codon:yes gene_type:complete
MIEKYTIEKNDELKEFWEARKAKKYPDVKEEKESKSKGKK